MKKRSEDGSEICESEGEAAVDICARRKSLNDLSNSDVGPRKSMEALRSRQNRVETHSL